ncbi:DUF4278 domain-containing protein [Synechococcus sp. PCC 7336]|uniref:DUF4278 domain-containing protein n=1 Tax=Synechococcus sp. PCC 7336 TaxID=195250 RepID=UPI00034549F9|nr:DUF4278 domain-containing protein [Synechococcus sp. PCC 7336]
MDILYRGHHADYVPPQAPTTDEVLAGKFRGHDFRIRKQVKRNVLRSPFKMRFRGH